MSIHVLHLILNEHVEKDTCLLYMNKIRRRNKNFYILKHYTLKYLLILFLLISALPIQAEDKIIDGIKIRYGTDEKDETFFIETEEETPKGQTSLYVNRIRGGIQKFPIVITFPETLMNS